MLSGINLALMTAFAVLARCISCVGEPASSAQLKAESKGQTSSVADKMSARSCRVVPPSSCRAVMSWLRKFLGLPDFCTLGVLYLRQTDCQLLENRRVRGALD